MAAASQPKSKNFTGFGNIDSFRESLALVVVAPKSSFFMQIPLSVR